jgi:hypothetical protein
VVALASAASATSTPLSLEGAIAPTSNPAVVLVSGAKRRS